MIVFWFMVRFNTLFFLPRIMPKFQAFADDHVKNLTFGYYMGDGRLPSQMQSPNRNLPLPHNPRKRGYRGGGDGKSRTLALP